MAKLGFVADLLSSEVRVGYLNGLAVTIIVGQLPKLFGFSTSADNFIGEVRAFVNGLDQTNRTTLVTGLGHARRPVGPPAAHPSGARRPGRGRRRHDRLRRARPGRHGVKTVGTLPQGVPVPALPWTKLSDVGPLLLGAVGSRWCR